MNVDFVLTKVTRCQDSISRLACEKRTLHKIPVAWYDVIKRYVDYYSIKGSLLEEVQQHGMLSRSPFKH